MAADTFVREFLQLSDQEEAINLIKLYPSFRNYKNKFKKPLLHLIASSCSDNATTLVSALICSNFDLKCVDNNGLTPLDVCANESIAILLCENASQAELGRAALFTLNYDRSDILKVFIIHKVIINKKLIYKAIQSNATKCIHLLLLEINSINANDAFLNQIWQSVRSSEMCLILLSKGIFYINCIQHINDPEILLTILRHHKSCFDSSPSNLPNTTVITTTTTPPSINNLLLTPPPITTTTVSTPTNSATVSDITITPLQLENFISKVSDIEVYEISTFMKEPLLMTSYSLIASLNRTELLISLLQTFKPEAALFAEAVGTAAAKHGSCEVLIWLLDNYTEESSQLLLFSSACFYCQENIIDILKERKYSISLLDNLGRSCLHILASVTGHAIGNTEAIPSGYINILNYCISECQCGLLDINHQEYSRGDTPLIICVRESNWVMAEALIAAGADVHIQNYENCSVTDIAMKQESSKLLENLIYSFSKKYN